MRQSEGRKSLAGALEDREQQPPSKPPIAKHISDAPRDELVLPQGPCRGPSRTTHDAITRSALAGDLE